MILRLALASEIKMRVQHQPTVSAISWRSEHAHAHWRQIPNIDPKDTRGLHHAQGMKTAQQTTNARRPKYKTHPNLDTESTTFKYRGRRMRAPFERKLTSQSENEKPVELSLKKVSDY